MSDLQCPKCGARMAATHSRERGGLIDRRRVCRCGHVDRAFIQPERIVKVIPVVRKHTQQPTN